MNRPDSNSQQLRRQLQAQQQQEAKQAAQRLLEQPSADPAQEAKKIQAYDAILAKLAPEPSFEKWIAVAVALVCVVIVGILYSAQRSETKLLLELEAETVSLRLAAPLTWPTEMPVDPPVQVSGVNSLDSLLFAQPLQSQYGDVWLKADQGKTALSELTLAEDGVVEVEIEAGRRYLYLNEAALSGNLLIAGQARLKAGSSTGAVEVDIEENLLGPESLDFAADGVGAVPTMLALGGNQSFTLYNLPVTGLAFIREVRSGVTAAQFVSTISTGAINLPEVKQRIDLRPGERLAFNALTGRVTQLELGEQIKIQFEGVAHGIQLGPQGFERDLAPSWLSYLYNQEKLAFVWSAFVFSWGILWSIRKTIFA